MRLIDKVVNRYSAWRIALFAVLLAAMVTQFVTGVVYAMSKQVCIVDGLNKKVNIETYASNVADVLAQEGITLGGEDETLPALNEKVKDGDEITVLRAVNITLIDGDNSFEKQTAKQTVGEVFSQFVGDTENGTVVNHGMDDEVYEGMVIEIAYLSEDIVSEQTETAYKTIKRASSKLEPGVTVTATEGQNGLTENTYRVYYENGKEVSREIISKQVVKEPVDEVIEYGEAKAAGRLTHSSGSVVSRSGGQFRYRSYIDVTATAYDLSYESCGKRPGDRGYGITASGMRAQYGVVAVDTRVIPLGTRLYIEAADGSWVYGSAVAGDTGGAIRGNKVDLFFNTRQECLNFGRRTARVYILE